MLFRVIIAVHSKNYFKHINTLYGQNKKLPVVKTCGKYSYCGLKVEYLKMEIEIAGTIEHIKVMSNMYYRNPMYSVCEIKFIKIVEFRY
jgi:hypothetical protein